MAKSIKPLSDVKIKSTKPKSKPFKLFDGGGLVLVIRPSGKKIFKLRYKFNGKDTEKTLGEYPLMSLADARRSSVDIKEMISQGINPNEKDIIEDEGELSFNILADKYFDFKSKELSHDYIKKQKSRYKYFIKTTIGDLGVDNITKRDIIDALNNVPNANTRSTKNTDLRETMRIVLLLIGSIFKYGLSNDLTTNSAYLTIDSKAVIPKREITHFKSITDKVEFKSLYRLLNDYVGDVSTKYGLIFLAHTALRSKNVRFLKWESVDFEKRVIEFKKEEMKTREPFRLPLTDATIEILREVQKYNSENVYVFGSVLSKSKILSENTLGYALKRMGIDNHTPHGFRSSFSTICYENYKLHGYNGEVIESQLAHSVGNKVKQAYLRSDFLEERRELLDWWDKWLMH